MKRSFAAAYIGLTIAIAIWFIASAFVNLGPAVAPTTAVSFTATNFTAAGTEAMVTLTPIRNFVAGSTGTSLTVTANSTLKLMGACIATANAGAAAQGLIVRIRVNPTGAATTSSPVVASLAAGTLLTTSGLANGNCVFFGDYYELSGVNQIGVSQIGTATAGNDITIFGFERLL